MLIKTLLNKIEHYKLFVYRSVYFGTAKGTEALIVEIKPRTNAQPECIECGQRYVGALSQSDQADEAKNF